MPAIAGQLVAAQDQPGADYALNYRCVFGAVAPDATQEKEFWLWLEALKKTEEPGGLPKVIHTERVLSESENDFDFAGEANANGEKVVAQGHVTRQADGNLKVAFSELGRPPAYSGKTELTLAPGERRVLRLTIITQPDNRGNLETVAVIWTPALIKDQNGHSRFEAH
jgi:hypothetical protein